MKKRKTISSVLASVGVGMIAIALTLQSNGYLGQTENLNTNLNEINIKNMAASASSINKKSVKSENKQDEVTAVEMEIAPAASNAPQRIEVFEGMTMEELAEKLNRSLHNEMAGKGALIAQKCIELGVDPYIATAIMLHETGCSQGSCSHIARTCHNFGGQKGSGCGGYQAYPSVDEGIAGMISNLHRNFYAKGLNTIETIGPRYAESPVWAARINGYVSRLRAA